MFRSLHVMVCILMSLHNPEQIEIEEHVKICLSCCHQFSRSYFAVDKILFWPNTGNFQTLMYLGEQRERHGPIRWYWKGTSERFIQQLKNVLKPMRRTTIYFMGKLKFMHQSNVLDWYEARVCNQKNDGCR